MALMLKRTKLEGIRQPGKAAAEPKPEPKAKPRPEGRAEPQPEAKAVVLSNLTPQIIKRVHEL